MDIHWRNTQKPVRFFFLDARAFTGVFLFLVHARTWVLILAISSLLFFWFLERRGLSLESAIRAIRSWLVGRRRPAMRRRGRRLYIDYHGK